MRLGARQKEAVLANRPGANLTRRNGQWIATWHDATQPVAMRWCAQVISRVDRDLGVWWWPEASAKTREAAIAAAMADN